MRKLLSFTIAAVLLTGTAVRAADLPSRIAPPQVPALPAFSWTGCYAGIEGGGSFGNSQHYQNDARAAAIAVGNGVANPFGRAQTRGIDVSGGLAGGTLGCNYQTSYLVLGLDNDFSWTDASGSGAGVFPFAATSVFRTREHWLATFRGRAGIAWDSWLFYATGGGAAADQAFSVCNLPTGFGCAGASKTIVGWAAGAGVEYAFAPGLSAKLEYIHADFGSQSYPEVFVPAGFYAARRVTFDTNIVRAGINYRFNAFVLPPVVARY